MEVCTLNRGQLSRPSPSLGAGHGGAPGAACEGQGWVLGRAGCWGKGSRLGGKEGTGSDATATARLGEPRLPAVPTWCQGAVAFLLLSSPSFASPCSKGRREEGGRASLSARQPPGARAQTYLLSWAGASLRSWEGKINRELLLTHPNAALLTRGGVGGTWNMDFAKGLNHGSPAEAAGKWELGSGAGGSHSDRWGPQ